MKIRSVEEIAEKYGRVTPGRSADYAAGVKSPKKSWSAETSAAKDSWAQGVQEAVAGGRFEKGVRKAGDSKWQEKAATIGTTRWGAGITAGKEDFKNGFAPYQAVIASVEKPPKGAKGDPRNYEVVIKLGTALHQKKVMG